MKNLVSALALILASGGFAFAGSDKEVMPAAPAPTCDWTGFYIGAKVGGGWTGGNNELKVEPLFNGQFDPNTTLTPNSEKLEPGGLIGGGEVGYNYQFWRQWVIGAEADFFGSNMEQGAIRGIQDNSTASVLTSNQEINWFGTVRGRIGYAAGQKILLFGTAGFAYADIRDSANETNQFSSYPVSSTETQTGWTAGGGFEIAINCHWSFKAEYLYFDLGGRTLVGNGIFTNAEEEGTYGNGYRFDGSFHTVTAGLNYKF